MGCTKFHVTCKNVLINANNFVRDQFKVDMKSLCAYHNVVTSCRKLHAFDVPKLSCDLKKYALFCTQYVYF